MFNIAYAKKFIGTIIYTRGIVLIWINKHYVLCKLIGYSNVSLWWYSETSTLMTGDIQRQESNQPKIKQAFWLPDIWTLQIINDQPRGMNEIIRDSNKLQKIT